MALDLPRDLAKGDVTRTATSPSEYWDLVYRGYSVVDGPAVASLSYEELTPAQKAARTRAEHKAQQEQHPDADPNAQAGDANQPTTES
jgi:hypothetical protein